jgi:pimeloyl-ACP methyl ester carboxylesterase
MNRRLFLAAGAATVLLGCAPSASDAAPAPFQPTRFSVRVYGTGPDVILIPGLTASRDVWNSTVTAVPGYRYHLVQVNGFAGHAARGNSQGPVVAPLAAEIGRYVEANRLVRPAIVGHSMGGTVAMMIGARTPDRVGKIMVVDMLPQPSGLVGSSAQGIRGLADSLRGIAATPGGRRLFESLIGTFGNNNAAASRSDPDVVGRAMHELATIDLTNELPAIRAPLTVVYAGFDPERRASADAAYRAGYARKRDARLVRIDDSGHMIMLDRPLAFQAALRTFLTR